MYLQGLEIFLVMRALTGNFLFLKCFRLLMEWKIQSLL